ncbi:Stage II sporulation protein E (SpoIIE) [Micromonospora pattaloongensis]|uniref:Stage II sporulation protein E (SpoIIE) n=1 Tax=Micromonospora pattaloongensis TaxID=405436 RepID=A0A1H3FLK5_9ACTN|nr:PP2C family protein-serine/threonine phosphatase [Micromonospora pattaloongensis]SDX91881.1 Stage II sporulation protein E (SpoIIE) [Micromonospora pattaloongensis]
MPHRLADVRRALTDAPADLLVEHLAEVLRKLYNLTDVAYFQVDYRLAALLPLHGGAPPTAPGSPAWRSFDHQTEVIADGALHLPVGSRGERMGVLRLAPAATEPEVRAELSEVATLLGHELAAVDATTDRYRVAARSRRLTLAAEMQWELLPGRSRRGTAFSLAGQLEPAYAVRGDSFDWADDERRLWLSVMNGMGEGVAAATATCLGTYALRNARRAGLDLADQAALADQALYAHYTGVQHLAALLMELDLATGTLTVVDAGSPRLIVQRDGELHHQELEQQFPLGMFDGTVYHEQRLDLSVGDRLVVVSDGVLNAAKEAGRYGEATLERCLRRTRSLPPMEAVRAVVGDLRAFVGGDLVDDAVVVCLDWTGPGR